MPITRYHARTEAPIGTCDSCDITGVYLFADDDDGAAPWVCQDCYARSHDGEHPPPHNRNAETATGGQDVDEILQVSTDFPPPAPSPMMLPPMLDRASRPLSFEQEVAAGGHEIASKLYTGGHAASADVLGYHSGGAGGFCYVEQDSSVDAEIVYSKLDLSSNAVATRFASALDVVRSEVASDEAPARLTLRCGGHVHVGLSGAGLEQEQKYGMTDVESLYHVWNHVEDVVYRLGSANWSKHRTLAGNSYTNETRKGLSRRGEIGRHFENDRGSLNFSNFLAARGYCTCGAFTFEAWEDCVCSDLPKATVEFRVFNGTANLRKIHAYTALSLALVEYAKRNTVKVDDLPSHGWTRTEEVVITEAAEAALRFILTEAPLTYDEKVNVLYCAEHSSLKEIAAGMTIRRNRRREAVAA
jgi:hypothetical protein